VSSAVSVNGGSLSSLVRVWRFDEASRRWVSWCTIRAHGAAVHALAWAPALGRAGHTLATAGKDRRVCIWKLPSSKSQATSSADAVLEASMEVGSEVWRVQWNLTGTVLATSGDDGAVRCWAREAGSGQWREELHVQSEHARQ
jgi:nucleoporin SEH1